MKKQNRAVQNLDRDQIVVGDHLDDVDLNGIAHLGIAPEAVEIVDCFTFETFENLTGNGGRGPLGQAQAPSPLERVESLNESAFVANGPDSIRIERRDVFDVLVRQVVVFEIVLFVPQRLLLYRLGSFGLFPWQAAALVLLSAAAMAGIVPSWLR